MSHADAFWADGQAFLKDPGPIVIDALPGARACGPARDFAFVVDADLRKRKPRGSTRPTSPSAFEKYRIRMTKTGKPELVHQQVVLKVMGIVPLVET